MQRFVTLLFLLLPAVSEAQNATVVSQAERKAKASVGAMVHRSAVLRDSSHEQAENKAHQIIADAEAKYVEKHRKAERSYQAAAVRLQLWVRDTNVSTSDAVAKHAAKQDISRLEEADNELQAMREASFKKVVLKEAKRAQKASNKDARALIKQARIRSGEWLSNSNLSKDDIDQYQRQVRKTRWEFQRLTHKESEAVVHATRSQADALDAKFQRSTEVDLDREQKMFVLEHSALVKMGDTARAAIALAEVPEVDAQRNATDKLTELEVHVKQLQKELVPDNVAAHAKKIWDVQNKAFSSERVHMQGIVDIASSNLTKLLKHAPINASRAVQAAYKAEVQALTNKIESTSAEFTSLGERQAKAALRRSDEGEQKTKQNLEVLESGVKKASKQWLRAGKVVMRAQRKSKKVSENVYEGAYGKLEGRSERLGDRAEEVAEGVEHQVEGHFDAIDDNLEDMLAAESQERAKGSRARLQRMMSQVQSVLGTLRTSEGDTHSAGIQQAARSQHKSAKTGSEASADKGGQSSMELRGSQVSLSSADGAANPFAGMALSLVAVGFLFGLAAMVMRRLRSAAVDQSPLLG